MVVTSPGRSVACLARTSGSSEEVGMQRGQLGREAPRRLRMVTLSMVAVIVLGATVAGSAGASQEGHRRRGHHVEWDVTGPLPPQAKVCDGEVCVCV